MKHNNSIAKTPKKQCLLEEQLKLSNFCFVLFLIFLPNFTFGIENSNGVLDLLQNGLKSWIPSIKTACLWVFWTLVVIDLVWTFGLKALSSFELGDFLATLIKKIMYIGIFLFLFNTDHWLQIIFDSFSQLATNVNHGTHITPSNIITSGVEILLAIWDSAGLNIAKTLFLLICGLIILFGFLLMAIDLLIVYLKFFLMNIIVFFTLTLGGLTHFKQIGLNPIMTAIKVGVELFMIQGIMAFCINVTNSSFKEISADLTVDLTLQILVLALIFCMITKMIPGLVEAVFNGTIGESAGASAGFRAVMATTAGVVTGAAVGAVGATRAIKAAKDLHVAEGGAGGMDLVKGVAKNLATASGEHLRDNLTKGRTPNQVANRLQEKLRDFQSTTSKGDISSGNTYQSGIDPNILK